MDRDESLYSMCIAELTDHGAVMGPTGLYYIKDNSIYLNKIKIHVLNFSVSPHAWAILH
jgi:hypothetical protein